MIHLFYICASAGTPSEEDLIALLEQSRARNRTLNITGMLLFAEDTYLQVLEGEKADVHKVFDSIKSDPRAKRIITLVEQNVSRREFPNWSMGFENLSNKKHTQLSGFSEIFEGKVDPRFASRKASIAVDLLLSFAENPVGLKPISAG